MMQPDKLYFFLKMIPPRANFFQNETEEERKVMLNHVVYWAPYIKEGIVVVFGPIADAKHPYGSAVVRVDTREQLDGMIAGDPANGIYVYEVNDMMAITKY